MPRLVQSVSIQIMIPSSEEGRDYELDNLVDFKHPEGVNPSTVRDIIEDAMDEAGYTEVVIT